MEAKKDKILVVEDDPLFRETITNIISSQGIEVVQAGDGAIAREALKNSTFSAVISDIKMPNMNGVELVEWIRKVYDRSFMNNSQLPVILMTGFSHIMETEKAKDLGIQKFLTKPFPESELIGALDATRKIQREIQNGEMQKKELGEDQKEEAELSLPEYCRVSLEDFVTDRELTMDVFVKLSEKKYIKIANKGGCIDINRIENYKQKGLHYLYIERTEFKKILDFNIMLSKVVATNQKVSPEKKKRFMSYTAEIILENSFVNGINENAFNDTRDFLLTSMDILAEDQDTFSLLDILCSHADHVYAHSVGVSMYSVMIAKKMGWKSSAVLFKLSFGGLMHDIGKKEFPPELLSKPRSQLTFDERKQLETHPFRGKEILESLKSAPSEVVQIAYQHHENMLGQGFPQQLSPKKIHPMAKIVNVANEFCKYALKGPNNPGVTAQKAVYLMGSYKKDHVDPEAFQALTTLVKEGTKKEAS